MNKFLSTRLSPVRATLAVLLLSGAVDLRAQMLRPVITYDQQPRSLAECHTWQVAYDDTELGRVYGTAVVDWSNHDVQIRVVSPATGEESILSTVAFTPPTADGRMEFVMAGESPGLHPVVAPSPAELPNLSAADGAEVKVGRSELQLKAAVATRGIADDTVTLTLSAEDDNDLIGHWHYRADPLTERARNGGGRVGAFSMPLGEGAAEFVGTQTGREEWTVRRPRIFYAEVLEDQTAQERGFAKHSYPRVLAKPEKGSGHVGRFASNRRRLLLVGSSLPMWRNADGSMTALESIKSDRADLFYDKPRSIEKPKPGDDPDEALVHAWERITDGMDQAAADQVRKLQAVIVTISYGTDVRPGFAEFTWNGAKVTWLLQFGDNTAEVRVVRTMPDGLHWEPTPVVFLPEEVKVEVETAQLLPVDSIDVLVAANGSYLPDPIKVLRVNGPGSRVYRSADPVLVYNPANDPWMRSGKLIPAKAGDRIAFVVEQQRGLFYGAADTELAVFNDPSELGATWHRSLTTCARIAGKPDIDWAHLPGAQVDQYTRYFVFYWLRDGVSLDTGIPFFGTTLVLGVPTEVSSRNGKGKSVTTTLTLGQHAAMLMMRDLFIELMKRQQASLQQTYISADRVLGFGKAVAQALHQNPGSLYSIIPVGTLNGKAGTLLDAVDDEAVKKAFGPKTEDIQKGKLALLRTGLTNYATAIQKSIDQAAAIKDTQREELLKLTGNRFDAVVAQLKPRLMKFDDYSQRWVPDLIARGYVDSIGSKQQEIEDIAAAAKIDTQLAVGILTAVASAPVMFSESALASFLTWSANGLVWAKQSVAEIWETHGAKEQMEFAVGASVVLGHLRYDEAKLRDTPWWKVALSVGVQGIGANLQALDLLSRFSREMSIFRGLQALENLDGGVEGFRKLSAAARADVQAAAIEAKALTLAGGDISASQARALFLWDQNAQQVAQGSAAISAAWGKTVALKRAITLLNEDNGVLNEMKAIVQGVDAEAVASARAAFARREELGKALTNVNQEIFNVGMAEAPDEAARAIAAAKVQDLSFRDTVISGILAENHDKPFLYAKISDAEVAWISGVQKEVDVTRMKALAAQYDNSWTKLKYAYEHGKIGMADQHQFITWRKQDVDPILDQVIAETEEEMTKLLGRPVKIERKAFGSNNLTSDYDISVDGPGAERVIGRFNARFRATHGGLESGYVFDTNAYTDPVYKLFKSRGLRGGSIELGSVELDTVRQFSYEHMAMRKYVPDKIWAEHKALLYKAVGRDGRKMMDFVFNEAEEGVNKATVLINKHLGGADAASTADANALLRANNDAYADVLGDIDLWRLEMERLDGLFSDTARFKTRPPDEFLQQFPVYRERLRQMDELLNDTAKVASAKTLRSALQQDVVAQMRDAQGTALYFASEAYQTEGAIVHVVDELQGPLKRKVTLASLKAPPVKTKTDTLCYISSFFENRANMFKEFNHLGVFDGTEVAGEKLAAKGAKYFSRNLESMKQAGTDLTEVVGDEVMASTVRIDEVRGDLKDVTAALNDAKMSGRQFVDKIRDASDKLAVEAVKNPQFLDLAKYLSPQFEDLERLRTLAKAK